MKLWEKIVQSLTGGNRCALLYVLSSEGSSPGRQGFGMFVSRDEILGSIGGGFMEHKLVELARSKLNNPTAPFLKRQVHRKDVAEDQSGMICSGEQLVAFYFLESGDLAEVVQILNCLREERTGILTLTKSGLRFQSGVAEAQFSLDLVSEGQWTFREQLGHRNSVYILGGGHVGQALSVVMNQLGFFVEQFDDREGLNTMINNLHAHRKQVIRYEDIAAYIPEGAGSYVTLVSFGYRTDKELLRNLVGRRYKYLGMMGSGEKVRQLFDELRGEGISDEQLSRVHSPIGLEIHSKTPEEIAISIAAEIIRVKNNPDEVARTRPI